MRLRTFDIKNDVSALVDLVQDVRVTRFMRSPFSLNLRSVRYWNKIFRRQKQDSCGVVKVIESSQKLCAGLVTVLPCSQQNAYELMYWLGVEFWGRGLATCAVAQSLQLLQDQGYQGQVIAHVACNNTASQRVLERNGFVLAAVEPGVPLCSGKVSLVGQYILNKNR